MYIKVLLGPNQGTHFTLFPETDEPIEFDSCGVASLKEYDEWLFNRWGENAHANVHVLVPTLGERVTIGGLRLIAFSWKGKCYIAEGGTVYVMSETGKTIDRP